MKKQIFAMTVLGMMAAVGTAANAAISGFVNAPTGGTRVDTFPATGFSFGSATGTKQINQVGYWSPSAGGLAVAHQVALYHRITTTTGNLTDVYTQVTPTVTVPAGSVATSGGYAWVTIPNYTLTDTTTTDAYLVLGSAGTDSWTNGGVTVNDATFGALRNDGYFSQVTAIGGGDLTKGTTSGAGTVNYAGGLLFGGPNIGFDPSVPEPTSLGLLGLGALGLIRRRRQA